MAKDGKSNLYLVSSGKKKIKEVVDQNSLINSIPFENSKGRNEVQKEFMFSIIHSVNNFLNNSMKSGMTTEQVAASLNDSLVHVSLLSLETMGANSVTMKSSGNKKKFYIQITMEEE